MSQIAEEHFGEREAESYDRKRSKLSVMKDAIYFVMNAAQDVLPASSNILCVGAGTGTEIIKMAAAHPNWRFEVVEPASAMMSQCKQNIDKAGFSERCTFHEGYVSSLPEDAVFDGATSILVSHFLMDRQERTQFFRDIYLRLVPGGHLFSVDIVSDMSAPGFETLSEMWFSETKKAGLPSDPAAFGRDVSVLPAEAVSELLSEAGFDRPTVVLQLLLLHAFVSHKPS
ncbi:class I SAM-dependent methyltransferase [Roseibium sp.]|uniref:class I SAM-dependent methyltransferase n=1 Tax=Roseibium sp. TaxID=1936156 RepID=UPI003B52F088